MSEIQKPKRPPDWNARYAAAPGSLYGDEPNEYLRMVCARSDFAARSALMLADGDGRNGTWLAESGCVVTAVDISEVATERAMARDRAAGVEVTRIAADLADWGPPPDAIFDAVFACSIHCEREIRARAFARAIAALAPGGWFVLEAFARTGGGAISVGLADQALRYDLKELEQAAAGLDVIEAFIGQTLLHEGARHQGIADVVRFAARARPTPP